jgi:hypothetical protein
VLKFDKYQGFQIYVQSNGTFVAIPADQGENRDEAVAYADTYSVLRDRIREHQNKLVKKRKLDLPVITGTEELAAITGIHLRNSSLTGVPENNRGIYPRVSWLVSLLHERRQHEDRIKQIEAEIAPYRVKINHHASINAETYAAAIDRLESDFKALVEAATVHGDEILGVKQP